MLFTGWAKKDDSGRLWWWSMLRFDGKSLTTGVATKLFKAVKSSDYWFRLAEPVGSNGCKPVSRLDDSYFDSLDAAYRKRLNRAYEKRVDSMRSQDTRPDSLQPAAATGDGKTRH